MVKAYLDGKILLDNEILRPEEYKKEPYYIEYLGNGLILRRQFHREKIGTSICAFLLIFLFYSLFNTSNPQEKGFCSLLLIAAFLYFLVGCYVILFSKPFCFNKKADQFWQDKYIELDPFKKDEEHRDEKRELSNLLYISIKKDSRGVIPHDPYYKYADERGIITFYFLSLIFVNSDEVKVTQSPNSGYILFLAAEIASYLEAEVKLPAEQKPNFECEIKMRSQNPTAIKITAVE